MYIKYIQIVFNKNDTNADNECQRIISKCSICILNSISEI